MSGTRGQIERFFRTLLLGDFEEDQHFGAQIVGGLISMVPVLDQVMDARDITGSLFRINQRGGFDSAGTDQLVNLGFAAFGAVPAVGSAFKTVFKPLWKERQAAKGAVHSGLEAIEGLLGLGKGGAIKWVRQELLGKWAGRTNEAIAQVDLALASCIELTEFIANAAGWKDYLIPDSVQALAKELLPSLNKMRGQIQAPLQRASAELREFLEDLLGEQAATMVMAVGQRAATASTIPGARSKAGHNAADSHPKGKPPPRQGDKKVGGSPETHAKKGAGSPHSASQLTLKAFKNLANQEKGLIGEHIVDYHEVKRLGGSWPHDQLKGNWSSETVRKLNVDNRPMNLRLVDLPKVNHPGLDAVWQHGTNYTVTEAKARASIGAAYGLGKFLESQGKFLKVSGLNPDQQLLHYLLSDSEDKRGVQFKMVQMSKAWVIERAQGEGLPPAALAALRTPKNRRVALVTFESNGAPDHAQALLDIHMGKPDAEVCSHDEHSIMREWDAKAIDAVEKARNDARRDKSSEPKSGSSSGKEKQSGTSRRQSGTSKGKRQ